MSDSRKMPGMLETDVDQTKTVDGTNGVRRKGWAQRGCGGMGARGTALPGGRDAGESAAEPGAAGTVELHAAMGQVDRNGGDGAVPGDARRREPDSRGESERAAE